jgi:DNA-binding GntR family transcriptional regulator
VLEHERMVDALAARDGAALREVLVQHLQHKRDTVLQLMRSGAAYPGSDLQAR